MKTKPDKPEPAQQVEASATFLGQVVELLRITFEGIGSLGESPVTAGQLWEARLDPAGKVLSRRRIGTTSQLAWPVSAPGATEIWALQSGRLVLVKADGAVEPHPNDARWQKLIGVAADGAVFGFVSNGAKVTPAVLRANGSLEHAAVDDSPETATKLAKLQHETRSYTGERTLGVDRSERGGRGFDVYLGVNSRRSNVSDCGDDKCGHASLALDPDRVLYVRSPRY